MDRRVKILADEIKAYIHESAGESILFRDAVLPDGTVAEDFLLLMVASDSVMCELVREAIRQDIPRDIAYRQSERIAMAAFVEIFMRRHPETVREFARYHDQVADAVDRIIHGGS